MADGIAKTSIYLPKEDLKLLKTAAVEAGTKVNGLLLNAVTPFLSALRKGEDPAAAAASLTTKGAVKAHSKAPAIPDAVIELWLHPKDRTELGLRNAVAAWLELPEMKEPKPR